MRLAALTDVGDTGEISNHKPKTAEVVAWAKSLWDRYVTGGHLLQYFMGCLSDRVLSDIVNTSALIPMITC
jgi:hypothetical protein